MQTIINLLGKMLDVHICLNFVDVCAQSNISICCVDNHFCCLFSFFFFFHLELCTIQERFPLLLRQYWRGAKDAMPWLVLMKVNLNDLNFRVTFLALGIANIDSPQVRGRGGYARNFYTGRLYIPFPTKKVPLQIPSIDKWYPFHIPCLELFILFNCCKCTVV